MARSRLQASPAQRSPAIRITERDRRILETIHAFDGMLSLKQIDRLFFSGKGRTQPRSRMRSLSSNGYASTPGPEQRHRVPLGETIYWLNREGAALVAARYSIPLREFPWRRQPRWSWLEHDLAVNDFRITVMEACRANPALTLQRWVSESEFLADPDTVEFTDRLGRKRKRQVRPDGFFTVRHSAGQSRDKEYAFLLEIDMATHSNPRFAREKAAAGAAYLQNDAFRQRFGVRYGRWLVVTTGKVRREHLQAQTERAGGNKLFYFTTFDRLSGGALFDMLVWRLAGTQGARKLIG